jgi:hypothetical protein
MRKLWTGFLALVCANLAAATQAQADTVRTIHVLDRGEPHDSMISNSGILWVGQSRKGFNSNYAIYAYGADDKLIASTDLPHSVTQIAVYDKKSVIVTGISISPNLSNFTILSLDNSGKISKRTTQVPMQAWATKWIGTIGGREFFTDPGGNTNDPETESNPSLAAQTLFAMRGNSPQYLKTRMRLPIGGIAWNNQLLVIQKQGIGSAASNAALVNPSNGQTTYLFENHRSNLAAVSILPARGLAIFAERDAGQIAVYDLNARQLVNSVATISDARSVDSFGHCAIVGSFETKAIEIINLSNPSEPVILNRTEIALPDAEFARLSQLTVDDERGTVYARSNFACNPMVEACDTDRNRVIAFGKDVTEVLMTQCR